VPLPTLPIDAPAIVDIVKRLNFPDRERFALTFADRINICASENGVDYDGVLSGGGAAEADALRRDGYIRLGRPFDTAQLRAIHVYLTGRPVFGAHIASQSDGVPHALDDLAGRSSFACYSMADVIGAPYLLEFANDPRLRAIAARYLGCVPTLYSLNAWWSFPDKDERQALTQEFHRDNDDFRNCVLFAYLTDVSDADGAHEYIRGTQNIDEVSRALGGHGPYRFDLDGKRYQVELKDMFESDGYHGDAAYRALFTDRIDTIVGPAGSAFFTDTRGLHRARVPRERRRLILWIRYGMFRNRAYVGDKLVPVRGPDLLTRAGGDATAAFINRLVIG
jgi:hypothetical protein